MSEATVVIPMPAANSNESSEHTTRFQPGNPFRFPRGVSGNPAGRPRVLPVTAALEKLLGQPLPDTAEGGRLRQRYGLLKSDTWATAIAHAAVCRALRSTETAAEICDRVEGKVTQKLALMSPMAVTIRVIYERGDDQKA
jgi:hypothetical protein